jgi:hypothetical protein
MFASPSAFLTFHFLATNRQKYLRPLKPLSSYKVGVKRTSSLMPIYKLVESIMFKESKNKMLKVV